MEQSDNPLSEPVCRPWLVRALKERPKLVEIEARQKFLDRLDDRICERRTPDRVARRAANTASQPAKDAAEDATSEILLDKLTRANEGVLERF